MKCVKGYGTIAFVMQGNDAVCPISGAKNCVKCYVITSEKAREQEQVKKEEG